MCATICETPKKVSLSNDYLKKKTHFYMYSAPTDGPLGEPLRLMQAMRA